MSSPPFNIQIQQSINNNNKYNIGNYDSYFEGEKEKEDNPIVLSDHNSFRVQKDSTIKEMFSPLKSKIVKGKEKQVTSIVIGKAEIKVKYEKDKAENNILIKFSDDVSKEKKKTKKEKLKLVDEKGKGRDSLERVNRKRTDYFGNPIKKKGKQKIFFKNEVEVVKIKSIKTLLPTDTTSNIICKCGCIIY